jgi:hypothetical protein
MFHSILAIAGGLLCDDRPIPDAAVLMRVVQAHQQKMDEVRENYTYHRIRRVEELDSKGAVKKTTVREREVFYVNGHQIGRLVKKDGNPLSESEDKAEQERVRKLTENLAKKPATFGKGGGVNLISMILAVSEVSNPRRAELNRRSALIFDFKGNPKAEAHGMESNAAKKLEGTVWIDEADCQVARLEVEFYDNFRVAGGLLASIQKGTVIKVEQSPIGEGLWMQTANEQHMNMRVITKGVHENVYVKSIDFKRFNVDAVGTHAGK